MTERFFYTKIVSVTGDNFGPFFVFIKQLLQIMYHVISFGEIKIGTFVPVTFTGI